MKKVKKLSTKGIPKSKRKAKSRSAYFRRVLFKSMKKDLELNEKSFKKEILCDFDAD